MQVRLPERFSKVTTIGKFEGTQPVSGFYAVQSISMTRGYGEELGKSGDLEDLSHEGLEGDKLYVPFLRPDFFQGEHDSQAYAADVLDAPQIKNYLPPVLIDQLVQSSFEIPGVAASILSDTLMMGMLLIRDILISIISWRKGMLLLIHIHLF
jgi:hypothetical protein